jgi:predicted transcriptional regulator
MYFRFASIYVFVFSLRELKENMNELLKHRLFCDDVAEGILEIVEKHPGVTTGEIEKAIGLSDAGARYRLLSLEAAQLIRRERIRGRVHYYLKA